MNKDCMCDSTTVSNGPCPQCATAFSDASRMILSPWRWRNCRNVGFKVGIWIAPWHLSAMNDNDGYGGCATIQVGPIDIEFHYSIGESWARRLEKNL